MLLKLSTHKSICLLSQQFNQSEDSGTTSLHPPLSHSSALIPLIVLITRNFIKKKVNVLATCMSFNCTNLIFGSVTGNQCVHVLINTF